MKNILHATFCALIFAPVIVLGQPFELLKDINAGVSDSRISTIYNFNGIAIFSAEDGVHGLELWRSDGTSANTFMLKDINPTGDSDPSSFITFNGSLFFVAHDGLHGKELWKTDGTDAGTVLVKDINTGGSANPSRLTVVGNTIYFFAFNGISNNMWKTDGTEDGTVQVSTVIFDEVRNFLASNGNMYFNNYDGVSSVVWRSDGTESGTIALYDGSVGNIVVLNNLILFWTYYAENNGQALFRTDGTVAGTEMIVDFPSMDNTVPPAPLVIKGVLFFLAHDNGFKLWRSDGTRPGTYTVQGTASGLDPTIYSRYKREVNGQLFFPGGDNIHGEELWTSDGTEAGTNMVADVTPGPNGSFLGITDPVYVSQNKFLYTVHETSETGVELWRSDGTPGGTFMVKDIWPGPSPNMQLYFGLRVVDVGNLTFILNANDGIHGEELWKTDGTEAGTQFVQDFEPGVANSIIREVVAINNIVYAVVTTSVYGKEIWVSNLSTLPISLFDFTGHLVGKDARLNWKTTGEERNSSYVLERSFDRINFAPVANITAHNAPGTNAYGYTDLNIAQAGKTFAYYRIKQIEPNRQSSYSNIVTIRMSGGSYWVKIQPNPVKSQLNIQLNSNKTEYSTLSIINMQGVVLMKKEITIRTGMQSISWDVSRVPAGSYILSIKDEEKLTKELFIKN